MSILFGNSSNINSNSYSQPIATGDAIGIRGTVNVSNDLPNGGTVSGEVVSKDGNQITLKLSNDQTISARLEGNSNIEVGNRLTFEVAKGGGNQTLLRPLFSNMAANPAVNAALKAAGLPLTGTNIAMTSQMMNEGMSVSRNALYDMARIVSSNPGANAATVVSMTNLNIPVTTDNINQYENYQNFKHQIMSDVINIADGLTDMMKESANIDDFGGMKLTSDILALVVDDSNEVNESALSDGVNNAGTTVTELAVSSNELNPELGPNVVSGGVNTLNTQTGNTAQTEGNNAPIDGAFNSEEIVAGEDNLTNAIAQSKANVIGEVNNLLDGLNMELLPATSTDSEVIATVKNLIDELNLLNSNDAVNGNEEENSTKSIAENNQQVSDAVKSTASNGIQTTVTVAKADSNLLLAEENINEEDITDNNEAAGNSTKNMLKSLTDIIKSDDFGKIVNNKIKDQLSLSPADVAKKGKIEELYDKINKQSNRILELMQANGKGDNVVAKSADNINANVKFMNDVNEFMNYVQLPLKMAGENAHGDLYVYTKKKNLADNDGNFTALLHLDMEHLGPMDVHIAMRDYTKVNTHFYLASEELLDFIEEHIDELNKRLEEKGYSSSINVSGNPNEGRTPITQEFGRDDFVAEKSDTSGVRLCFDVRA